MTIRLSPSRRQGLAAVAVRLVEHPTSRATLSTRPIPKRQEAIAAGAEYSVADPMAGAATIVTVAVTKFLPTTTRPAATPTAFTMAATEGVLPEAAATVEGAQAEVRGQLLAVAAALDLVVYPAVKAAALVAIRDAAKESEKLQEMEMIVVEMVAVA